MRPADEVTWEQEYWDDLLHEFGPGAYVEARYGQWVDNKEYAPTESSGAGHQDEGDSGQAIRRGIAA